MVKVQLCISHFTLSDYTIPATDFTNELGNIPLFLRFEAPVRLCKKCMQKYKLGMWQILITFGYVMEKWRTTKNFDTVVFQNLVLRIFIRGEDYKHIFEPSRYPSM